jgi:hypothetical protein
MGAQNRGDGSGEPPPLLPAPDGRLLGPTAGARQGKRLRPLQNSVSWDFKALAPGRSSNLVSFSDPFGSSDMAGSKCCQCRWALMHRCEKTRTL